MELTEELYKKLYKHALFICWNNEDLAAAAVNSFLLSPSYSGKSESDYWAYATTVFHNKRKDDFRKRKLKEETLGDWCLEYKEEEIENIEEKMLFIEKHASKEEFIFLMEYYSLDKKYPAERLKAHRLIKKIKQKINDSDKT